MGGTVAAIHAGTSERAFDRIVLSAPMVEVHDLPLPRYIGHLTGGLRRLGFGGFFVPRGRRAEVFDRGFEGNVLTSDPGRFTAMMGFVRAAPELALGAPTVGWLHAAFAAMRTLEDFGFCRAIRIPMLVVVPGADRVVSVPAMERFAQRLKAATLVRIPHARHEILMERDSLRNQFWAAFDAFIPGEAAQAMLRRETTA
jgi:lysophospholipase